MTDIKRAGYDLAEQFITKYPESFKIRWSDKMSLGKLTSIEEICREKKIVRAREIFSKLEHGDETCLENKKKDLDALLDLFAFYNASTENPELPTLYVSHLLYHLLNYLSSLNFQRFFGNSAIFIPAIIFTRHNITRGN